MMLKDINPGGNGFVPGGNEMFEYHGKLYFRANDGTNGYELWVTDGTVLNTVMLKDINVGADASSPLAFTIYKDTLYFKAADTVGDFQLFMSDGTAAGTGKIPYTAAPNTNPLTVMDYFTVFDDALFFPATYTTLGLELWSVRRGLAGNSITPVNNSTGLSVYPNPGDGYFTLKMKEAITAPAYLQVYDITGRQVHRQGIDKGTTEMKLDLSGLSGGMYQLVVNGTAMRLVIQ